MTAKSTRTPEGDAMFFTALAAGNAVRAACVAAGYARSCVYAWRREDAAFAEAWRGAIVASLEAEADRRLRARYVRSVTYRGEIVGVRCTCPDPLLFARYDALRREREGILAARDRSPANVTAVPPRSGLFARWFGWIGNLRQAAARQGDSAHAR